MVSAAFRDVKYVVIEYRGGDEFIVRGVRTNEDPKKEDSPGRPGAD